MVKPSREIRHAITHSPNSLLSNSIFQIIMNAIIGDSRVLGLKRHRNVYKLHAVEGIWGQPGAGYNVCETLVNNHTIYNHPPIFQGRTHFYIFAGICSLTTRLQEAGRRYQEVIFHDPSNTISRVKSEILELNSTIKREGGLPIFCTLISMHLSTWNELRLAKRKTRELRHRDNYENMQSELEMAVAELNEFIVQTNMDNGVATPLIHTAISSRKHGKTFILYKKHLADGCHPKDNTYLKIINSINRAISQNEHLH